MADEHPQVVIIKRHYDHEEVHHGGAWKIAFADFMTAMMALFLVLWLISATNPKMRIVIARYFNPVKLADQSAEKKGLNDPAGGGPSRSSPSGETTEKHFELPPLQEKRALFDRGGMPTHDDVALFRDPYAVLSEISGQPSAGDAPKKQPGENKLSPSQPVTADDSDDTFRDPFTTVPTGQPVTASKGAAATESKGDGDKGGDGAAPSARMSEAAKDTASPHADGKADQASSASLTPAVSTPSLPPAPVPPQVVTGNDAVKAANTAHIEATQAELQATDAARAAEVDATKLRKEISTLFGKDGGVKDTPNIEVKNTDEGVLISLTDEANYAMFAIGSAEPKSKTIEAMEKIAQVLKSRPGMIVVRGHTDGRPYKIGTSYDNWQLSAARAQMAHYMLVRGGLDEKRIDRIEGYADHKLKVPNDALAAENRRIEILLRKERS